MYKALCGGSQCEFEFQLMASEVRAVVMADSLQDRVSYIVTNVVDAHIHMTHETALNNANVSQHQSTLGIDFSNFWPEITAWRSFMPKS